MIAAARGEVGRVNELLAAGADVNAVVHKHLDRTTALMCAAERGNDEIVIALIAAGADIHIRGPEGLTALMWAVNSASHKSVKALIEAGANVNEKDASSETPLMQLVLNRRGNLVDERLNCFAELCSARADINATTLLGDTALHLAAASCDALLIKALVSAGANINEVQRWGLTPLMLAARQCRDLRPPYESYSRNRFDCVKVFLAAGADTKVKDHAGRDVRDHAAYHENILSLLGEP